MKKVLIALTIILISSCSQNLEILKVKSIASEAHLDLSDSEISNIIKSDSIWELVFTECVIHKSFYELIESDLSSNDLNKYYELERNVTYSIIYDNYSTGITPKPLSDLRAFYENYSKELR